MKGDVVEAEEYLGPTAGPPLADTIVLDFRLLVAGLKVWSLT